MRLAEVWITLYIWLTHLVAVGSHAREEEKD